MKVLCAVLLLAGLVPALPASAAHKNIMISDSLLANADQLKVKAGVRWLGIHKWRFGDYAVLSSKAKGTSTKTHSNLFETKTDTRSSNAFAFVMGNATTDSAFVQATHAMTSQSRHKLKVAENIEVGRDELVQESEGFTATIAINRDTSDTWTLFMGGSTLPEEGGNYRTVLTRRERTIALSFVTSRAGLAGPKRPSIGAMFKMTLAPPALGYEFIENGQSLGAVQYFSEGLGGSNTFFVWIRRDVDAKSKLMLAAVMTAVLELKSDVPMAPEDE